MEDKIRQKIIEQVDELFDTLADTNFQNLTDDGEMVTEEKADNIESIFISYRNVIAGTDWDGQQREYEKYKVGK